MMFFYLLPGQKVNSWNNRSKIWNVGNMYLLWSKVCLLFSLSMWFIRWMCIFHLNLTCNLLRRYVRRTNGFHHWDNRARGGLGRGFHRKGILLRVHIQHRGVEYFWTSIPPACHQVRQFPTTHGPKTLPGPQTAEVWLNSSANILDYGDF